MAPLKWKNIVGLGQLAFHPPNSSNLAQPKKAIAHLFTTYFKDSSLCWLPSGWPSRTLSLKTGPSMRGLKLQVSSLGELHVGSSLQSLLPPSLGGFLFYFILFIYIIKGARNQ